MNVFIAAVCLNLLTLVNVMCVVHNINLETILKILKDKPRKSVSSLNGRTNDPVDVLHIIPGFYMEKPKNLSQSLFRNPKPSSDDIFEILSNEVKARDNKRILSAKTKNLENDYLQEKILKVVNNLKVYRAKQRKNNDSLPQSNAVDSNTGQKVPVKKLLGRIFQGIGGIDYTGRGNKWKQKTNTASAGSRVLNHLLQKILNGNLKKKKYYQSKQNAHRFGTSEEEIQKREDLLGNIFHALQNVNQGSGNKIQQHPSLVILSPESFDYDITEDENTAKESIEESDDDISESLLYNTRRKGDPDIGSSSESSKSTETDSSDYERNPGNPFTIHKNKYKQNWLYNHFMDGDHMNINPFGPQFGNLGPTGPELFFGRKWWYFNQDDYKPMG